MTRLMLHSWALVRTVATAKPSTQHLVEGAPALTELMSSNVRKTRHFQVFVCLLCPVTSCPIYASQIHS